jgi:hypothetical protein
MVTVVVMWVWLGIALAVVLGWATFVVWEGRRWAEAMRVARWEPGSVVDPETGELSVVVVRRAYLRERSVEMSVEELTRLPVRVPAESVNLAMAWADREAERRNNALDDLAREDYSSVG